MYWFYNNLSFFPCMCTRFQVKNILKSLKLKETFFKQNMVNFTSKMSLIDIYFP